MNRDGYNKSLWQETPAYAVQASAIDDDYDVIIVGGGITGLVTALQLQLAGKKCLVAEARTIGFGTTGGTSAHLNTFFDSSYPEIEQNFSEEAAKLLCGAAKESIDTIEQNIIRYRIDCGFSRRNGYLYANGEKQVKELQEIYEASVRAGCEVEYIARIPMNVSFDRALVFKQQGQFDPASYLTGIAKAFEENGGRIREDCRVTKVEGHPILTVETSRGSFAAGAVIYATHIPPGVNLLHFRCAPYRSYVMALELADGGYPDGLIYDMLDPYHYYRSQEKDGKRYLIAGGEDHKTAHEENTGACFLRLDAEVRKYFNIDNIAYKWSSQYYQPVDGLPYIGHLPGNPNYVFTATGYNGNGMIYSHVAARLFTNLLTDKDDPLATLLDPNRIKPIAGFTEFVKESADVMASFAKKIFSKTKLDSLSDLSAGEGAVVEYEGESVALFKDKTGHIHAANPECTHVNCRVVFNNTELSWDCPCHGARYAIDGSMLTGPARRDLGQVDLADDETQ
jgi:glycine/D-amino acid oxidase-like deaminating enzyme/nitrite reductase/ring-hydroxylating ferredoxin subunit